MKTLAIDTCFAACSVALGWSDDAGETVLVSRFERMEKGHAERLIPMIGEVMAAAPFALDRIERIAVTQGPGTFTGVRIGIAAARALSLAAGADVRTMSSLELMARTAVGRREAQAAPGQDIAIAIDARRDEIYFQLFDAGLTSLTEPLVVPPANAAALLKREGTLVFGSGAELLLAAARDAGRALAIELLDLQPDARYLVEGPVADIWESAVERVPPRPLYLRPPDAKPQDGKQLARVP
jgi:tRNA threonylcarbamoyl adenosine modification protein YeaZ